MGSPLAVAACWLPAHWWAAPCSCTGGNGLTGARLQPLGSYWTVQEVRAPRESGSMGLHSPNTSCCCLTTLFTKLLSSTYNHWGNLCSGWAFVDLPALVKCLPKQTERRPSPLILVPALFIIVISGYRYLSLDINVYPRQGLAKQNEYYSVSLQCLCDLILGFFFSCFLLVTHHRSSPAGITGFLVVSDCWGFIGNVLLQAGKWRALFITIEIIPFLSLESSRSRSSYMKYLSFCPPPAVWCRFIISAFHQSLSCCSC